MKEIKPINKNLFKRLSERVDDIVSVFSPKAAFRRKQFRTASEFAFGRAYRGADRDRLRENWIPGGGSADSDLLYDLADLRERSRDLNRNDGYAAGITDTMVTNVVGTGIIPQSRIDREALGLDENQQEAYQRQAEKIFKKWMPYADAGNRMDFVEIQQLVDRQIIENGEVIILPVMKEDGARPYKTCFQIIESDRLETPLDKTGDKSIRSGVEIGENGEPIAYWIRKTHPGDGPLRFKADKSPEYVRIAAFDENGRCQIFHLYWMKRPGQTRGIPFFAPILNKFKDLGDYMEAELVAARIAACFALFIEKTDPASAASFSASKTNAKGQRIESLEPGMIEYLSPGEKMNAFNPNRTSQSFDAFVERVLRMIGSSLGMPYELVAKDFSKTNYSSARAALLQAYRYFRCRQEWLAKKFCQPVWEMVLDEAYLRNEFEVKQYFKNRAEWTRARWISPGWPWVDPLKEVKASNEAVANNLSSLADEAASQGKDYEEILEQRAREEALKTKLGLKNKDTRSHSTPSSGEASDAKDEDTDNE